MSLTILKQQLDRIESKLLDNKDVLTFDEACLYMGKSKAALYKLTSAKKIKHSKPGGREINFLLKDIKEYMLKNPVKVAEEESIKYLQHHPLKKSA